MLLMGWSGSSERSSKIGPAVRRAHIDNPNRVKAWPGWLYAEQTRHFVKRSANGSLQWGFEGKNKEEVTSVTLQDVQWLLQYLGRVTDAQIRTGLAASGATTEEVECFARSLRDRIDQLQQVSGDSTNAQR
jgi:hypothetical protein